MKTPTSLPIAALALCAGAQTSRAQPAPQAPLPARRLQIRADKTGPRISPTLHGLMTEEINYSYDGGLYAGLIRNRAFKDDAQNAVHWSLVQDASAVGAIVLDGTQPVAGTALTTGCRRGKSQCASPNAVNRIGSFKPGSGKRGGRRVANWE